MRTIKLKLPRNWNELTFKQLKFIAQLIQKGVETEALRVRCALRFSGLKASSRPEHESKFWFWWKYRRVLIESTVIKEMADTLRFITHESLLTRTPKQRILWFYGPGNGLQNITFDEFESCETYFSRFTTGQDTNALNMLCATLYRPKAKNNTPSSPAFTGDIREPFNANNVKFRAKWFRFVSNSNKFILFMYYAGSRNAVAKLFPEVFPKSTTPQMANSAPDPLRLANLVNAINGGDVTKNEAIRKTAWYEVLVFIQNTIQNKPKK